MSEKLHKKIFENNDLNTLNHLIDQFCRNRKISSVIGPIKTMERGEIKFIATVIWY